MAREWVIHDYSGFEGLRLQDRAVETPGPTEIRLRIEAFALNWGDNDLMNDRYSFSFSAFPARVGMEAAGIVEAVGAKVAGIAIGDRYCTLPHFYDRRGASGETLVIDQAFVTKAPEGLSAVEAAFDPVGGDFMARYSTAMAKGGILFHYGRLSGTHSNPPFLPMIQNSLWYHAYSLFNYVEDAAACARGRAFVYEGIASGKLKPNIDRVFPMEGYIDAWRYLRGARKSHGKVVVETGAKED